MMRAREALLRGDAKGGLDHFFRHSPSGGEAAWWMQEEKNRFTLYCAYPHLQAIAVAASEMPVCPDEEFCARLAANASWVVSMGREPASPGARGCSADTGRGDAAAATRTFRGNGSRRRRGRDVDVPQRLLAATPRP